MENKFLNFTQHTNRCEQQHMQMLEEKQQQQQIREESDNTTYMEVPQVQHAFMVQSVRVRVRVRHVLRPQPFRSTALDFDCDSDFKSDTDCTRTNDAALFAYAVDTGKVQGMGTGFRER